MTLCPPASRRAPLGRHRLVARFPTDLASYLIFPLCASGTRAARVLFFRSFHTHTLSLVRAPGKPGLFSRTAAGKPWLAPTDARDAMAGDGAAVHPSATHQRRCNHTSAAYISCLDLRPPFRHVPLSHWPYLCCPLFTAPELALLRSAALTERLFSTLVSSLEFHYIPISFLSLSAGGLNITSTLLLPLHVFSPLNLFVFPSPLTSNLLTCVYT